MISLKKALLILTFALLIESCINSTTKNPFVLPSVETLEAKIDINNIIIGAKILSNGGDTNVILGVCWSEESYPTIEDSYVADTNSKSEVVEFLVNESIEKQTLYFGRAFIVNSKGISYGSNITFFKQVKEIDVEWNDFIDYSRQPNITKPVPSEKLKNREFLMYTINHKLMGRIEFGKNRLKLKDNNGNILSSQSIRGYWSSDTQTRVLNERWDTKAAYVNVYSMESIDGFIIEIGSESYIFK